MQAIVDTATPDEDGKEVLRRHLTRNATVDGARAPTQARRVNLVATLRDAQGYVLTDRQRAWTTSNRLVVNGTAFGNLATAVGLAVGDAVIGVTSEGVTAVALTTVV